MFYFFETKSHVVQVGLKTHCVAEDSIKFLILLFLLPGAWLLVYMVLDTGARTSCVLGKLSTIQPPPHPYNYVITDNLPSLVCAWEVLTAGVLGMSCNQNPVTLNAVWELAL